MDEHGTIAHPQAQTWNESNMNALTAISPLDGRYAEKTAPLQAYFSELALFKYRWQIEIQWLIALLKKFESPTPQALKRLAERATQFDLADAEAIKKIEHTCNHDVKAVEYYLKEFLANQPELKTYSEWVHFACTSEDINNLAYGLMCKDALQKIILPSLTKICDQLRSKAHEYAGVPMLARTHGQAATPTTVGKEFANTTYRLARQIERLKTCEILGKFNGAVGNYNAHQVSFPTVDWPTFNQAFVESLGLEWNPYTTQIEPHDYLAEILHTLVQANTILIDFSRDTWAYISLGYFKQKTIAQEVGSSTMPHKVNPIDFENAEGNLSLSNALAQFLAGRLPISRYQRDLVDSTLLRNLGSVFAYAQVAYASLLKGLDKISLDQDLIQQDLANHPEVLAEAIQTVMRLHKLPVPYEQLKTLTRGQKMDMKALADFIRAQALPENIKEQLLQLTPADYIGYAKSLAEKV